MWSINTVKVADHFERLSRKLGFALKEERAKASQEKENFEKFKAEHADGIARVDTLASEVETLKAQLAEQVKRAAEMENSLQQNGLELNAANLQKDEALAAKDRAIEERDQAIFERDAAAEEKKMLQAGLPDLVITSMGCPGIIGPFGRLLQLVKRQGRHESAVLASKHIDPFPEELSALVDPAIASRVREAQHVLADLSTSHFLEKLKEDLDMPVEAILAMKP